MNEKTHFTHVRKSDGKQMRLIRIDQRAARPLIFELSWDDVQVRTTSTYVTEVEPIDGAPVTPLSKKYNALRAKVEAKLREVGLR